jgi:hypothetical protein
MKSLILSSVLFSLPLIAQAQISSSDLLGTYELKQTVSGNCYSQIEVKREFFTNSQFGEKQDSLGIYGLPDGTGKIVAQIQDINQGVQVETESSPASNGTSLRAHNAFIHGNELKFYDGDTLDQDNRPASGILFDANFDGTTLRFTYGYFDRANGPVSGPDKTECVYTRIQN